MNAMATVEPGSTAPTPPTQPRPWRSVTFRILRAALWFGVALGLLTLVLTVLIGLAVPALWLELREGVNITVNGKHVELGRIGLAHAFVVSAALALVVTLVVTVICTIVPMALLVALLVAACAVLAGLGIALLSVFGAAALVMSPLLAIAALVWFVWWLARRRT